MPLTPLVADQEARLRQDARRLRAVGAGWQSRRRTARQEPAGTRPPTAGRVFPRGDGQLELLLLCEYATLNGGEQSMFSTLELRRPGRLLDPCHGPAERTAGRTHSRTGKSKSCPSPFAIPAGAALPRPQVREALADLLRRQRVDLLHANSLAMGRLAGPVAAELGLPSIAHLRDIVRLSRQAIVDLNCHTRLLAVSQATRDYHVAAGLCGRRPTCCTTAWTWPALHRGLPRAYLHRELGLPPEAILVGAIGQIGLRKGHDVLVEAAIRLAPRLPQVHYLIVGGRFSDKAESRSFEVQLHAAADGPLAAACTSWASAATWSGSSTN